MTRRLPATSIALVGKAAVVVAGFTVFLPEEDRHTFTSPGPVHSVDVDVEAERIHVVAGAGNLRTTSR